MRKMKLGVEMVLLPLLQLGQDPTFTKWFSIASRTRGMCLGASSHGMVQRAFLEGFTKDIMEAGQQEEADEAAAAAAVAVEEANEAFQREKRARTRNIAKMMRKTNLAGELMTVVQSTSVIQQFQFDILTADVARKELVKRRQE